MIQVHTQNITSFVPEDYFTAREADLAQAQTWLQEASGTGNDFVGWVHLPQDYDKEEFARIKAAAQKIQQQSTALVVVGIGGSYLGARGVIEALCSPNYNQKKKDTPNLYFAGNTLSADALNEVVELIGDQDFSINVISKSGTTTEPAISFRFFKELCEKKYGKEGARERIYATTDAHRGVLKSLADAEGYETFVVPDDVGGRYSVLTAVGLLPFAPPPARKIPPGNMPPPAAPCMTQGKKWRSWRPMSPPSASWRNGGSSSTAKARARKARVSSPPAWNSPPTCTPWASTSSRANG